MSVLGIDPGANTGLAVVRVGGKGVTHYYELVTYGLVKTKPHESDSERCKDVTLAVGMILADYHPDLVVIEKPGVGYTRHGLNVRSLQTLSMLYGAALAACHDVRVIEKPAPIGRRGLATKTRARLLCRTWFSPDVEAKMSEHSCDAAVLATSGLTL